MSENQIQQLIQQGIFPDGETEHELIQTHISWVILDKDYVYKIKKPVKLSFLDFSTLDKRKYFCEQELILNQRLTSDIYLSVQPVTIEEEEFRIGVRKGEVVDYAVVMRRLDNHRQMNNLLKLGEVDHAAIKKIENQLLAFHKKANIVKGKISAEIIISDFEDIEQIQSFVEENISISASDQLMNYVDMIGPYIKSQKGLIAKRDEEGFTRDCHGDLHSGNIFLLDEPVIFDCIEFNHHFRQIDILNELAFFSMDLDFANRHDLSKYFIEEYNRNFEVIRNKEDETLFLFYKLYRANVKTKINAIKTLQTNDISIIATRLSLFKRYFQLFLSYCRLLEARLNQ